MKKKNREALRTALNEFRDAYRIFLDDVVSGNFASAEIGSFSVGRNRQN